MVLDHVPEGTGFLVVGRSPLQPDGLGHGDLHVLDGVAVPHPLEQGVGEAQDQEVLHRLLSQVVVDPEDPLLVEDLVHHPVQLAGAGQVAPERLLDHHPGPVSGSHLSEPPDDGGEPGGRSGQVVEPASLRARLGVHPGEVPTKWLEAGGVVERAGQVGQRVGERLPDLLVDRPSGRTPRPPCGHAPGNPPSPMRSWHTRQPRIAAGAVPPAPGCTWPGGSSGE